MATLERLADNIVSVEDDLAIKIMRQLDDVYLELLAEKNRRDIDKVRRKNGN